MIVDNDEENSGRRSLPGGGQMQDARTGHTVEKIGGTSMSRARELIDTIFIGGRAGSDLYNRIFVVSAFAGITNLLLEHKKSGKSGVYALFSAADDEIGWKDALGAAATQMHRLNAEILNNQDDRKAADDFVRERIDGARDCLIDLQRLCSYGHFQLVEHMQTIREMLSSLGEAHSANTLALLLRRHGVNARFVDLTGWRGDTQPSLHDRISSALAGIDVSRELPVLTGYAQCSETMVRRFGRGYSEVTFANVAAISEAREAIIHKEFHLSSADPSLVGEGEVRKIGRTNYDVADQLSNMGMEAIHPNAAKILRQAEIPLRVANAFLGDDPGTLIDARPGGAPAVEIITGLPVTSLELFEQDMVGVKGYDARIIETLTRHKVRIVSKTSNANTIVHHFEAPLKAIRRVERDLYEAFPSSRITIRRSAIVSAIGQNLRGLKVMQRGLIALDGEGIAPISTQETGRGVDVQFVVPEEDREKSVKALHKELVSASGGSDSALDMVA